MRTTLACMLALGMATGCAIVTTEHRDGLRDGGSNPLPDGQMPAQDGGNLAPRFDDRCGSTSPRMVLSDTTRNIEIDTRTSFRSSVNTSCGASTPGNDVFIAVDVVAGDFWHFHLSTNDDTRDPMLFLTPASSCDTRMCEFVSAVCTGRDDEHFAFEPSASGRWFIGIDDSVSGGGQYLLEAFKPVCGDGVSDHGEACDDGNRVDGDGCDRMCRIELSQDRTVEVEPNDNRREANVLRLPASNELTIGGSIGGPGACIYADVFALNVPDGAQLLVDALNPDDSACASRALTPFSLALQTSSGSVVSENMEDANNCSVVRATGLVAGQYFVRVRVPEATAIAADYRLRFRVVR